MSSKFDFKETEHEQFCFCFRKTKYKLFHIVGITGSLTAEWRHGYCYNIKYGVFNATFTSGVPSTYLLCKYKI